MALKVKDVVGLILAHIGWTKVGPVFGVSTGGSPAVAQQLNFGAIGAAFGLTPAVLNGFLANVTSSIGLDPQAIGNALMKNPVADFVKSAATSAQDLGSKIATLPGALSADLKVGLDSVTAAANQGLAHTDTLLGIGAPTDVVNIADIANKSTFAGLADTARGLGVADDKLQACFGTLYNPGPFEELYKSVSPTVAGGLTEITDKLQKAVTDGLPTDVLKGQFLAECNKLTSGVTTQLDKDKAAFAAVTAPITTASVIGAAIPNPKDAIGVKLANDFGTPLLAELQGQITDLAAKGDNLASEAGKAAPTTTQTADLIINRTGAPVTSTKVFTN
jgi:hypothetical protein